MSFIDNIKERAKAVYKTIVLPEGMERRTWEAAEKVIKEKIAKVIILATPTMIYENAEGIDISGMDEDALRAVCDEAEPLTSAQFWPFPTYGDLLFGV